MRILSLVLLFLLFSFKTSVVAIDFITQSQNLTDGNTLVSNGGLFELGFFSPGNSANRYLGIWYKNISVLTYVWVANRENPINNTSGVLTINSRGNVVILSGNNTNIWSANSSKQVENPILQLLNSGNLVLKDGNSGEFVWQSFDYPTDTLLPGMKVGWDFRTQLNRRLSAWKNPDDPSPGSFYMEMENHSYPDPVMWNGTKIVMRSGPWNGLRYSSLPTSALPILVYHYGNNKDELYFSYTLINNSLIARMTLNQSRYRREAFLWSEPEKRWRLYATIPRDYCDSYGVCGVYGRCDIENVPACQCLKGFTPRSTEKWRLMDYSDGCTRNRPLNCTDKVGFARLTKVKLPDTTHSWVNESMSSNECREMCLSNCNCSAYANTDIRGSGSGCALWFGDLIDIKDVPNGGQDLYVRMLASDLETKNSSVIIGVIVAASIVIIIGLLLVGFFILRRKKNPKGKDDENQKEDLELPIFELSVIANATDNFSFNNKLGEGGFGSVYRGKLANGHEIAVKRLSRESRQGVDEFKNEVILIAKLQHRNLVKLLGCCLQGEEKMLVYEYMPNKSLDFFIFDQVQKKLLDWSKRFNIICGVARGILYLHQDSRLRIIHRDLKASNVLLDVDMNPKISDFGMARTFGGDQTEGNTRRVVGTYGYMAPEYAIDGQFSVKSDVFSFGILMLEIISGEKNRGFYRPSNSVNLIGHAWKLWNEGRPLELIDDAIGESYALSEVLRCIHVSFLCVQQHPEDRPTMSTVVLMLSSESALPQPKQPGFFMETDAAEGDFSEETRENRIVESQTEHLELQKFPLPAIISATDDFSINNKLGEGGFGPVYRGTLNNGQEIAVKRLSSSSGQGLDEFLNEVILIAKLQHINLVKLLGCCIKGEEKVLIYEYMPNKSLDFFIFDQTRSWILDWSKRFNIICGTARGIVYLHQDSRLRIVHRDLKASNVLLDSEMNPKISDFGVARIFGRDQTVENTKRVIGTYGYMAPEYAIYGLFSTKSDVFSFGVLLLEIVSGKKNRDFFHPDHSHGLLGHAWLLWKEGRQLELIDPCILDSSAEPEVTRCIHVGLLCVQHRSDDRPIMSSVVTMLVSETALPEPQKPGFFMENDEVGADSSSCKFHSPASSTVGLTITVLDPR